MTSKEAWGAVIRGGIRKKGAGRVFLSNYQVGEGDRGEKLTTGGGGRKEIDVVAGRGGGEDLKEELY